MKILQVKDASYSYHGIVPALSGVSLDIAEGEMLAIIGSNGSGKSTLLQLLCGLKHPSAGRVLFRGEELTEKKLREGAFQKMFRSRVGIVFQNSDIQLFCPTVLDELVFGPLQLGMGKDQAVAKARETMATLGIGYLEDRPTHMLSGGEKKRVAIGSVLTMGPEVLLLDEPTSGLDPKTESFLTDLVIALSESGRTIVIATHNLELVDHLQPRVAVMSGDHRIEKTGHVKDILTDAELLVKVNLIHEHKHKHGNKVHSHLHTHYLFHDHDEHRHGKSKKHKH